MPAIVSAISSSSLYAGTTTATRLPSSIRRGRYRPGRRATPPARGLDGSRPLAEAPIYFTSIRDDSVGGDTGGDGPTSCSRGNWGQITLSSVNANVISYATIRCGGTANSPSILGLVSLTTGAALTLSHVTLAHANKPGVYGVGANLDADHVDVSDVTSGIYIKSNS